MPVLLKDTTSFLPTSISYELGYAGIISQAIYFPSTRSMIIVQYVYTNQKLSILVNPQGVPL